MSEKYNFGQELEQAEKQFDIGAKDTFKFKEGENRIRVLSPGKPLATHRVSAKEFHTCYGADNGCPYHTEENERPNVKFVMWVLDRSDGKVKLAYMPYTIMKYLRDFQNNPEYEFFDLPMPYDVIIKATKAGTKDVDYSVIAARSNVELGKEELEEYGKKKDVADLIESWKAKERLPSLDEG